jgi:hypothetical protein
MMQLSWILIARLPSSVEEVITNATNHRKGQSELAATSASQEMDGGWARIVPTYLPTRPNQLPRWNSVEVHPQLSYNRLQMDGMSVAVGSLFTLPHNSQCKP